ncbi:unnamed protein product [Jaminaea pallidilutea]
MAIVGDRSEQASPSSLRPPIYAPSAVNDQRAGGRDRQSQDGFQFDIVPRPDDSSFQAGYQGLQQRGFEVWLRGDVLLKGASSNGLSSSDTRFSQCTVELLATENLRVGQDTVRTNQVYHASSVLWRSSSLPTSSSRAAASPYEMPSVMPFQFSLPEHLPHCVHLPGVNLEYRLVATLYPAEEAPMEQEPITKSVLVHVTRYSPPARLGDLLPAKLRQQFTETEKCWTRTVPMDVDVAIARTLFRRGEPIKVRVQVAPPGEELLTQGLRIRSVEAELLRVVTGRVRLLQEGSKSKSSSADSISKGKGNLRIDEGGKDVDRVRVDHHGRATLDGWEPHSHLLGDEGDADLTAAEQESDIEPKLEPVAASSDNEPGATGSVHRTLLSYSGKSCRFSRRKPLVLFLTLVPPFTSPALPHPSPDHDAPPAGHSPLSAGTSGGGGGCESVSQETDLSKVEFWVRIWIRLRGGTAAELGRDSSSTATQRASASRQSQDIMVESEVYVLPSHPGFGASPEQDQAVSDTSKRSWSEAEEFDGYENLRDDNDAFGDMLGEAPPPTFDSSDTDGEHSAPPEEMVPSLQVTDAEMRRSMGNPAFVTSRRHEDSAEAPPTLQQSLHDLQIFPSSEETEDQLPPPHPDQPGSSTHGFRYASDAVEDAESRPPAWSESTEVATPIAEPSIAIDGVGTGELRQLNSYPDGSTPFHEGRMTSTGHFDDPPPPDFESRGDSNDARPLQMPTYSQTASSPMNPTDRVGGESGSRIAQPPPYANRSEVSASGDDELPPPPTPSDDDEDDDEGSSRHPMEEYFRAQNQAGSSSRPRPMYDVQGDRAGPSSFPSAAEEKASMAAASAAQDRGAGYAESGMPTHPPSQEGPDQGLPPAYADFDDVLSRDREQLTDSPLGDHSEDDFVDAQGSSLSDHGAANAGPFDRRRQSSYRSAVSASLQGPGDDEEEEHAHTQRGPSAMSHSASAQSRSSDSAVAGVDRRRLSPGHAGSSEVVEGAEERQQQANAQSGQEEEPPLYEA